MSHKSTDSCETSASMADTTPINLASLSRSSSPHTDHAADGVDPPTILQFPRSSVSGIRHRPRSGTFKTVMDFKDFEGHPVWQPGAEPGIDPSKPDGGQGTVPNLQARCHITIVDFSQEQLQVSRLDNDELVEFIKAPQPSWAQCRWINVNGLSWDVIQVLGSYKGLDPLNIEDTMTTSNLPKVDWRHDQAFITLTCQKLMRRIEDDGSDESDEARSMESFNSVKSTVKKVRQWFTSEETEPPVTPSGVENGTSPSTHRHSATHRRRNFQNVSGPNRLHTLQGYRSSRNTIRTEYMEENSALSSRGLAVMVEQVSMFMTTDNTVISFFEQSADDVEKPILARLATPATVIRQSCNASMVIQAILDAIIDMAMPVTSCYADVLGDLELDVLNKPRAKDTQKLYIIVTEINKMFSLLNPIQTLVKALRDRAKLTRKATSNETQTPPNGITIASETYPYLSDVYDHCILVTGDLASLKQSAENMVQLIFNAVLAKQSGIMTSLSIMSAIVLPLMLMTSYFGQNFEDFPSVKEHSVGYL
ncbi:uncharacterized protein GGS22DRAFT_186404 [Annulohypoxylon maeteangense]|uniref:uncharacterized protein n=1 Tax=Annulohypoxylon maeteangense TaxID=1927788 RepID=UPI0020078D49|nr:uncharacterized protein GGS22DRAFT_186404 [Annulohypoxylon maeteangense]KAI0887570.1 hypothetical protein GGS22DRAFT_186404 [Annulohypoxylon maeteangense]